MVRKQLKRLIRGTHFEAVVRIILRRDSPTFSSSSGYWDERYRQGGTSGEGSYGRLATFKAVFLNDFVSQNSIANVIEFGSGDGNQLTLSSYPHYTGIDVSETIVKHCRERFKHNPAMTFLTLAEYDGRKADLSLSLDVVYHLVEDEIYVNYMETLFNAAERYVIIYSSNKDETVDACHVRHRKFTDWVLANQPNFEMILYEPNQFPFEKENPNETSFADFYIFKKIEP